MRSSAFVAAPLIAPDFASESDESFGRFEGFEDTITEDLITTAQPDQPELEDHVYQYLKTCENGARLSQIESDLGLPRSKVVESIRNLAKSDRLAQRDRHFFAIG